MRRRRRLRLRRHRPRIRPRRHRKRRPRRALRPLRCRRRLRPLSSACAGSSDPERCAQLQRDSEQDRGRRLRRSLSRQLGDRDLTGTCERGRPERHLYRDRRHAGAVRRPADHRSQWNAHVHLRRKRQRSRHRHGHGDRRRRYRQRRARHKRSRARSRSPSRPVNDAPSFTAGANQTVLEDAGAQSIAGWATAMSPGPAERVVTEPSASPPAPTSRLSSPSSRRSQPPERSPTPPPPNANGLATITVTALDNGGTANGGTTAAPPSPSPSPSPPSTTPPASPPERTRPRRRRRRSVDRRLGDRDLDRTRERVLPDRQLHRQRRQPRPLRRPTGHRCRRNTHLHPRPRRQRPRHDHRHRLDNGGTANGGINTSAAATFTITVTPVNDAPSFNAGPDQSAASLLGAPDRPRLGDGHHARPGGRVLPERHLPRLEHQRRALRSPTRNRAGRNAHVHADPARTRKLDRHRAR